MQAPSACNQQPWEFIVIDDIQILKALSSMSKGAWMLANVTKAIAVVMTNTEKSPRMRPQDCAAATQNILLDATRQHLGAVWIGVYPLEERMEYANKLLNITKNTVFSLIALGEPNKEKEVTLRYDESRVHYNKVS
jgi:nitroreductase